MIKRGQINGVTRGYCEIYKYRTNISKYEALFRKRLGVQDLKIFNIGDNKENSPLPIAFRFMRALSKYHVEFQAALHNCIGRDMICKEIPVTIFAEELDCVIVFKNLLLKSKEGHNPLLYDTYEDNVYLKDVFGYGIHHKWETAKPEEIARRYNSTRNIIKHFKKYEKISISKWLSSVLKLTAAGYRDDQIRDLAEAIIFTRKPIELEFAKTSDDFFKLYNLKDFLSNNCMQQHANKDDIWKEFNKQGLHPACMYAYIPFVAGAAYTRTTKNSLSARTILYYEIQKSKDGNFNTINKDKIYHGRIYAINNGVKEKFLKALHDKGIFSHPDVKILDKPYNTILPIEEPFEVPAIKWGSSYYMPLPYFDNIKGGIEAKYDETKGKFIAKFNTKIRDNPLVAQGWMSNRETTKCHNCGGIVRQDTVNQLTSIRSGPHGNEEGPFIFCGNDCASQCGYIIVNYSRNVGTRFIRKDDPKIILDAFNPGCYYASKNIAIGEYNCNEAVDTDLSLYEEDDMLSCSHMKIRADLGIFNAKLDRSPNGSITIPKATLSIEVHKFNELDLPERFYKDVPILVSKDITNPANMRINLDRLLDQYVRNPAAQAQQAARIVQGQVRRV